MSKKGVKIAILTLCSALVLSIVCVFMFRTPKALAINVDYVSESVQDYYTLGQTFVSPEAKVTLFNGTSCDCVKQVLHYPNGNAYSASEYVLTNPGKYTVKYYADYQGESVCAEDSFVVKSNTYGLTSSTSSAYYGNTGAEKGNIDGLIVSLAAGDVFTFNKAIDLSDKKKGDAFLSFFAVPEMGGTADVKEFNVRLTDAMDPTNYVEIVAYANSADDNEVIGEALYYGARASNQPAYTGLHFYGYDPTATAYDGSYYRVHKDLNFTARKGYPASGASLAASRGYGYEEGKNFRQPFTFAFDYEQKKVFGPEYSPENYWNPFTNRTIADLDDSWFFDELWGGFTTGEVFVSIYSGNYVNSSFNFVITEIYDEDLSQIAYQNDNSPKILVDLPSGEMPYAIKGSAFNVFTAKAYSVSDGEIGCQALVYQDYHSSSRKLIPVTNGAFTPIDHTASYSIVYRATDSFGNHGEKVVDITVVQNRLASLSLTDEQTTVYTGVKTDIKQPIISNTNGNYVVTVKAILGSEKIEVLPSADGSYSLYTLNAGNYTIKYFVTDYNGVLAAEYNLTVYENPNSVFVGEPFFPKAFVKNVYYTLPEVHGKAFNNGATTDLTATVKYAFDNGETFDYSYGDEIEMVADEKITITYSLPNALEDKVIEVPVTDVGVYYDEFSMDKYLFSKEFTSVATENGIDLTVDAEQSGFTDANLFLVKPVLITDFSAVLDFTKSEFKTLRCTFTDTVDTDNVLKIEIYNVGGGKLLVKVNDGVQREITKYMTSKFTLKYDCILNSLYLDDFSLEVLGVKDFANKTAYFEMDFEDISGKISLKVGEINGQLLSDQTSDYALPLYYFDVNSGKKVKGDKIVIKDFIVEDFIRFDRYREIKVTAPDGSVCKTVDGITMSGITDFDREYEITVDQLGVYKISGKYGDGYNDDGTFEIRIGAYDEVAPVITISEENKSPAVYVGTLYNIATATANDNLQGNVAVTTIVMDVEGKTHIVTNAQFTFTRAGNYRIMYYAVDSFGNVGFAYYDVVAVVKGV